MLASAILTRGIGNVCSKRTAKLAIHVSRRLNCGGWALHSARSLLRWYPADPLINITLTYNAVSAYALPRKLGFCKSCRWCSLLVRKTCPSLERIRQRDLNPVYPRNNNPVYPQISDIHAVRVASITNKVFQSYNTGFSALG